MLVLEPQMVEVCEIGLLEVQIFTKIIENSHSIVAGYVHPYIRYC